MPHNAVMPGAGHDDYGKMPAEAHEPKKEHPSFFGKKDTPTPAAGTNEELSALAKDFSNLGRRLMVLEERYANLQKKVQLTEKSILKISKEGNKGAKVLGDEFSEYRTEFVDLRDKVKIIVKELKDCAKSDEVKIMQHYLDVWEPMNFVTRMEFDKVVAQLQELQQAQHTETTTPKVSMH
jgi:hypothetical protein